MGENDNENTVDNGVSILWEGQCFALEDGEAKRIAVPVGDEEGADHYEALTPLPCGTVRRERVSLVPTSVLRTRTSTGPPAPSPVDAAWSRPRA